MRWDKERRGTTVDGEAIYMLQNETMGGAIEQYGLGHKGGVFLGENVAVRGYLDGCRWCC